MSRRDNASARRKVRCAVYTRKSSDEGLEQSFNSLHAQRDACEAYIASQKHEGWVVKPEAYDDGGLSGGSMERPALLRLLNDVRARHVDVVVVYKVDRLTRSLADFAKLTDLFDETDTSFVSVTQQFNTATSMGRLTLNVLLSFAQFEREVAGERIRDKIALSKRRGMWMGGLPPLGYDGIDKKLVVNAAEAETVRSVFERYLEAGSVASLKRSLDADGVVSKRRIFSDGRRAGGIPFSRGALYQILRNRLYRGEIAHRGEVYPGNHEAIVDADLWTRVQDRLSEGASRKRGSRNGSASPALLAGLVFDTDGDRMTPTHANKAGRRYRYYTSASLVRGGDRAKGIRVPASDLETLVETAVANRLADPLWVATIVADEDPHRLAGTIDAAARLAQPSGIAGDPDGKTCAPVSVVERITVADDGVTIQLGRTALAAALDAIDGGTGAHLRDDEAPFSITRTTRLQRCGKQTRLILGAVDIDAPRLDEDLIRLVRDGHRWFNDLRTGCAPSIAAIAKRDGQDVAHVSRTISIAFLAPDIVEMILAGRQPIGLTPERLKAARPLPPDWNDQRSLLLG